MKAQLFANTWLKQVSDFLMVIPLLKNSLACIKKPLDLCSSVWELRIQISFFTIRFVLHDLLFLKMNTEDEASVNDSGIGKLNFFLPDNEFNQLKFSFSIV